MMRVGADLAFGKEPDSNDNAAKRQILFERGFWLGWGESSRAFCTNDSEKLCSMTACMDVPHWRFLTNEWVERTQVGLFVAPIELNPGTPC